MSSGTACVTGCEVVSKVGLSKGHAGKTRHLNLTAMDCLTRFTLARPQQPTPRGAWACVSPTPRQLEEGVVAVGGVGAGGGPRG